MADSKDHLKSVVEQSLAILNQSKNEARTETSRRRSLPVYVDAANLQKVAVVSASNALASLWKISAHGRADRPPRKAFLQLKLTNGA
ncbi:MAG TPA: hypothetical protein VK763_07040 [Terriglobales bacterium]|jgi:hypothetical protein|nr:hypothetical protein [Terriglobales bacterium]